MRTRTQIKEFFTTSHSSGTQDVFSLLSQFLHPPPPLRGEGSVSGSSNGPLLHHLMPGRTLPSTFVRRRGQARSSAVCIMSPNHLALLLSRHMRITPLWASIQPILHESTKTCQGPPAGGHIDDDLIQVN
ncbi:unnamed protein product [Rangifer tarandus platyrhynchus]|uniref:Uncharacterized protein n=1 Tax=Rangifer tarandus platyrhynchus TaxID=3082113 RepID=A0AC59Y6W1_RANTA